MAPAAVRYGGAPSDQAVLRYGPINTPQDVFAVSPCLEGNSDLRRIVIPSSVKVTPSTLPDLYGHVFGEWADGVWCAQETESARLWAVASDMPVNIVYSGFGPGSAVERRACCSRRAFRDRFR